MTTSSTTASSTLANLLAPLIALQRLLARFNDQGLIIGGVAASLLGKPRLTADVDAVMLVSTDDLPRLVQAAALEGLAPRIADAEAFARRNRVLLLRHQDTGIDVDVSLGMLPFEVEAVERSVLYSLGDVSVRLPTPEDLIVFKAVAHRPRDLLDIQAIIASHPGLDRARIQDWLRQFAQALDMPELWDDIAGWL